jgi:hypothetical protein
MDAGLGGFGGYGGGMGGFGFNPMMGGFGGGFGGFNPMMGGFGGYGGFNPMMSMGLGAFGGFGGFNPMMGGFGGYGFNPMMSGYGQFGGYGGGFDGGYGGGYRATPFGGYQVEQQYPSNDQAARQQMALEQQRQSGMGQPQAGNPPANRSVVGSFGPTNDYMRLSEINRAEARKSDEDYKKQHGYSKAYEQQGYAPEDAKIMQRAADAGWYPQTVSLYGNNQREDLESAKSFLSTQPT